MSDAQGHFYVSIPQGSYPTHAVLTMNTVPPRVFVTDTTLTTINGDTTHVTLIMAANLSTPSPPDAYGYRVYDRYDTGLPCVYDWVELNPAEAARARRSLSRTRIRRAISGRRSDSASTAG